MKLKVLTFSILSASLWTSQAFAANHWVTIHANLQDRGAVINKDIYGQFAEHLGHGIYGGLWVGHDSDIPNTKGFRNDVVQALRDIKVPLLRWPGGCFADQYHWRDGIGPQADRPITINSNWGGVDETNAVGTHEFFDLADLIGADTYINGNLGTGSAQEMADWIEYMTSDSDSALANQRRANGRREPWNITYFGIGNEAWGCGGNMGPEQYVGLYDQYRSAIQAPAAKDILFVGSGGTTEDTAWTDVLSDQIHNGMDGISFHFYTLPNDDWDNKGSATEFDNTMWFNTLARTYRMKTYLKDNIDILDRNDPSGQLGFYVDEWGTWYDTEEGREPGFLYQQNTLRDAVVAAVNLNLFHEYAKRVHMTNIAQMVNVLQAMILTDGAKMVKTPTYYIYDMYKVFQDAKSIPFTLDTTQYSMNGKDLPAVTASLAQGTDGRLYMALVNLDPEKDANIDLDLNGEINTILAGRILTASTITAKNTFDDQHAIEPQPFQDWADYFVLPAKSVVVLTLK
ncbi:alpha-N-arabinofuranosidase [Vibrio rhizosphaerae]|uniref:alpha-N-arabinofuranosidase n=1 Tax=Vibrio rhizosphaerae TaxID=398736 RepID=UPI00056EA64C|nr:alpha-L-arabinofuranosidase C-terminal domain-containing protein [Vibrio rhizosphaerae]